jgi:phosphatidate cytidylyltransferase
LNNFVKRALTAIVFVALLLGCTFWSQLSFTLLFFVITIVGIWEFYTLAEKGNNHPQKIAGTLAGAVLYASTSLVAGDVLDIKFLLVNLSIVFLFFIIELFSKADHPFTNIAFTLLGLIYVAIPFSLLNFITSYNGAYSYQLLFGFFFILWSNDTGAYLVGSAIGKHKLFPRVSPGKTWEGSIGGAILSYVVAFIIAEWYTVINRFDWMVIATILIIAGSLGDLVESLFKRSIDVKDSGNILPGHGGILDRFDSLILATPFVFVYLYIF